MKGMTNVLRHLQEETRHGKHLLRAAALLEGTSGDGCRMGLWGTVSSPVLVAKYSCTACSRSNPVACW